MNIIIFNGLGLILIALVVWWFWLGKSKKAVAADANKTIDIIVDNGVYSPATISAKVGQPISLRFLRKDETPCSATVIFADFDESADLPIGKPTEITITPETAGEFEFTCQMGMYRGKLIVTPS